MVLWQLDKPTDAFIFTSMIFFCPLNLAALIQMHNSLPVTILPHQHFFAHRPLVARPLSRLISTYGGRWLAGLLERAPMPGLCLCTRADKRWTKPLLIGSMSGIWGPVLLMKSRVSLWTTYFIYLFLLFIYTILRYISRYFSNYPFDMKTCHPIRTVKLSQAPVSWLIRWYFGFMKPDNSPASVYISRCFRTFGDLHTYIQIETHLVAKS